MRIGFIGLGKMGSRMVLKLLNEGHEVVVWNRSVQRVDELSSKYLGENIIPTRSIEELVEKLDSPKIIWTMLPSSVTQETITKISELVSPEDIIIDGGNSYYKDSEATFEKLKDKKIRYLGVGVSGGIIAETNGYPLMVGGDRSAYELINPILETLSQPNGGFDYFGTGGAGHFVKMVHNGIEYGQMQALAEGFGILKKSNYNFDLAKVSDLYTKGTIISGFLMDRANSLMNKNPELKDISGEIAASGEGEWTVIEGHDLNLSVGNIEQSLEFRKKSHSDSGISESYTAKFVSGLRNEFGGHPVRKKLEE